jgi:hypothetical protein
MFDLADLALDAPVNEPDSWPNTSLSKIVSGIAPQLSATKWRLWRRLNWCRQRATISLPVPVSP